jgi:hypothetical protein
VQYGSGHIGGVGARGDLAEWVEIRLLMLMEDGGSVHMIRGYADHAAGRQPNHESVVGEPYAAEHYHEGYRLAAYELGDLRMSTQEEELAA